MVKYSATELDATFRALADPTRRAILRRLAAGERTVSELAAPFEISLPAITKHLHVLQRAGLVEQRKDGRMRHCRIVGDPLRRAGAWIEAYEEFWSGRLDALEEYLEGSE
jgi:DNA-binding transcriptional ArsR family regulator